MCVWMCVNAYAWITSTYVCVCAPECVRVSVCISAGVTSEFVVMAVVVSLCVREGNTCVYVHACLRARARV